MITVERTYENYSNNDIHPFDIIQYFQEKVKYNMKIYAHTMIVMHFNSDLLIAEHKTYCTDFIKYHIRYSENHCSARLQSLCLSVYPDDLKISVNMP